MDPLVLAILKGVATSCLKLYVSYVVSTSSPVTYKSKDLGYKVPRWYMNPGVLEKQFYAYGTSVEGDEFQSLDKAKNDAVEQMTTTIRLTNQKMVKDGIRYDTGNVRERRLVELFLKNEGLEDYVLANMNVDKKEIVKVPNPKPDLRAFVRISMDADAFMKHQEEWLNGLKRGLMAAKTEDIMSELDADEGSPTGIETAPPIPDAVPTPSEELAPEPPRPLTVLNPGPEEPAGDDDRELEPATPAKSDKPLTATADDAFGELDKDDGAEK